MQVTHKQREDGTYQQIVPPQTLRAILLSQGESLARPLDFGPEDEWDADADENE